MSDLSLNISHPHYILDAKISSLLIQALENNNDKVISKIINQIDSVQFAYFLLTSTYDHRKKLIRLVKSYLLPEILTNVTPELRKEIIKILGIQKVSGIISTLSSEDIVDIIEDLDLKDQSRILNSLPKNIKSFVNELLSYPKDSAGRLINKDILIVPEYWTVEQLIEFLRNYDKVPQKFYQIFVVNPQLNPIGEISLNTVISAKKETVIKYIMKTDIKIIKPGTEQEEVSEIFHKYNLLSAPVINKDGRIIGAILIDDVINVIHQEAEKDILHLGMVSQTDINSRLFSTVFKRSPWLMVNLFTATLSSIIIGLFSNTLQHFIELSIIMPIIASMSGNAGLQALTVTVRAIATKQLTYRNSYRLLLKESFVGFTNGIILAVISSIVIMVRFHNTEVEILFSVAMIITFTVATLLGAAVPIILNYFKIDPAVSSSIIICAASDSMSFLIFLGLATIFLL